MINELVLWTFTVFMFLFSLGLLVFATFGLMFVFGAPWVPTNKAAARAMLRLADVKEGETVTDLGSGDGTILIVAAKEFGAGKAIGHEIHPGLNLLARLKAQFAGVSNVIRLKRGNVFTMPIEQTDIVTLYLLESMMDKLRPKLKKELDPNTRIVSNGFKFPGIEPRTSADKGESHVHLYLAKDL